MRLQIDSFPEEALNKFGAAPDGSFLLVYFSGEWEEYYASWVNRTSLEFNQSKYYALGSKYADGAALMVIALVLLVAGCKTWPNKRQHMTPGFSGI